MTSFFAHADVQLAIRALLALTFLSAAAAKMRHWRAFEGVVANYRLLPRMLVPAVAYALPPLEAAIGAALLTSLVASPAPLQWWAALGGSALLGVFAAAMAVNLLRGRAHIDCGCFQGALRQTLRWSLVARNATLMLLLAATSRSEVPSAGAAQAVNGLMAGCALFMILQSCNALWAVRSGFRGRSAS